MAEWCPRRGVELWAYCLVPNHVHLVAVPEGQAEMFRRYARTGRPLGGERFVTRIERLLGRVLRPHKRGPRGPWKHQRRRRN